MTCDPGPQETCDYDRRYDHVAEVSLCWFVRRRYPGGVLDRCKILTVDRNFSIAEAIAISGNKIAVVGPKPGGAPAR